MHQDLPKGSTPAFQVQSWAERNGFSHWAVAMIWLIIAFVLFQVAAGLVFTILLFATGGLKSGTDVMDAMMTRLDLLFIGNSSGQILFLGLATFLIVKAHIGEESKKSFLRLKWNSDTANYVALGTLLVIAVQPLVLYLGHLNSLIPIPETFEQMQADQYRMIIEFLKSDGVIWFALFNIAVVPAVCEELLFRGYVLRAFEKSWGIITAIVVSGIIFGLFHLQLGNMFPLATLGIMFAVMTWLSGSIWPAVGAHFVNNGAAVILGSYFPDLVLGETTSETLPPIWLLILSILCTAALIKYMLVQSKQSM